MTRVSNYLFHHSAAAVDETGKYKTNKCTVELFMITLQKHGIEVTEAIRDGIREKVLPGNQDCINYVQAVKELNLRIINDESTANRL